MKLYLDTEFTDLVPGNKLISIALVNENGDAFYAELTDTYERKDCSNFVIHYVLPFLKGKNYQMSRYDCALKIGQWIEDHDERCIIACDSPAWDLPHLKMLLEPIWPENLEQDMVHLVRIPDALEQSIFLELEYDVHNALDDAQVMRIAEKIMSKKI
jgi:hypothetical protein